MEHSFGIYEARFSDRKFIIEEDLPEVGWYLYVYRGDDSIAEYDHLQDTLELAKEFAFEKFGVPIDKWQVKQRD